MLFWNGMRNWIDESALCKFGLMCFFCFEHTGLGGQSLVGLGVETILINSLCMLYADSEFN